jgi:hypothetical protein
VRFFSLRPRQFRTEASGSSLQPQGFTLRGYQETIRPLDRNGANLSS